MAASRIYLSPPDTGELEKRNVIAAMDSGWIAPIGPDLEFFEKEVSDLCGREFGVALSSGTAGLHLGLLALNVRPGDVVICSTLTFVATANAILYSGATPVFVDSDFSTGNISLSLLEVALAEVSKSGRKIGAVIPVDFLGKAACHSDIVNLCASYDVPVLVDAAESLGAMHLGKASAGYGEAAILSFNGNKIATTSGGGMLVTDDEHVAKRVRFLSTQAREPAPHYEHHEVGYNYRLSNVLAALGRAQLERLPAMIANRRRTRERYRSLFDRVTGVEVFGGEDKDDNCWLTAIVVTPEMTVWAPEDLSAYLEELQIESRPLWKPMHMQSLHVGCESYVDGSSEALFTRGLALPSGSNQTELEWGRISSAIESFLATHIGRAAHGSK